MALIELNNVSHSFGERCVLANVDLAVEEGEFVSIVGASASGKTTLLKIASGLLAPSGGIVRIAGEALSGFPGAAAIVFQNYSLLPWLSAIENVRLAVESAFPDWPAAKHGEQAQRYLEKVGLGAAGLKKPANFPAECGSGWRSRAPSPWSRGSSSSTSRSARWTP